MRWEVTLCSSTLHPPFLSATSKKRCASIVGDLDRRIAVPFPSCACAPHCGCARDALVDRLRGATQRFPCAFSSPALDWTGRRHTLCAILHITSPAWKGACRHSPSWHVCTFPQVLVWYEDSCTLCATVSCFQNVAYVYALEMRLTAPMWTLASGQSGVCRTRNVCGGGTCPAHTHPLTL